MTKDLTLENSIKIYLSHLCEEVYFLALSSGNVNIINSFIYFCMKLLKKDKNLTNAKFTILSKNITLAKEKKKHFSN